MTKKQTAPAELCSVAPSLEVEQAIYIIRAKARNPDLFFWPNDVIEAANSLNKTLAKRLKRLSKTDSPKIILDELISIVASNKEEISQRSTAIQLLRRSSPLISGDDFTPGLDDDGNRNLQNAFVDALEGEAVVQREAIQAITDFKQNAPASIVRKLARVMLHKMDPENQLFALQEISNFGTDLLSLVKSEIRELIVRNNNTQYGDEIKIVGCRLLGEIRDTSDEMLALLLQLSKSDQNREVRCEAVSTILQIGREHSKVCEISEDMEEKKLLIELLAEFGEKGRQLRQELEKDYKPQLLANAPDTTKRRRAYARDKLFLEWHQIEGLGVKEIVERWNAMHRKDRQVICPYCTKDVRIETVKKALKKAKLDEP